MKRSRGQIIDVHSVEELEDRLTAGATSLRGWRLHRLDLTRHGDLLSNLPVKGATFVGCRLTAEEEFTLVQGGALVLPGSAFTPVEVFRGSLYGPRELYDEQVYTQTLDARAYAWSQSNDTPESRLAVSQHDHSIDEALASWTQGRRLVGVMGGHALARGEKGYAEAARLGQLLGGQQVVATGGGPGAMEAANLGALLARHSAHDLVDALSSLAAVPTFRPSIDQWAKVALEVLDQVEDPQDSLGIPTWHYGHEPPNVFATAIAKYFGNAVREAVLLEVCNAGIVFLPGAAGTVQEVFQDACENYYADESSVAPMVLVGRAYWTETVPAWPLLQALAKGRVMESRLTLVDTIDEAAAAISQP